MSNEGYVRVRIAPEIKWLLFLLRPTILLDNVLEINREIHVQREESGFRTRGRSPEGEWSGFGILCADRSGTVVCPPESLGSA
jgi:hypothetical protein